MKVNMVKAAGGFLRPADEESQELMLSLENEAVYSFDVKLNHNYKLLQKIHVFYKFCAQNYFGDLEVKKNEVAYVKEQLLITAGYYDTVIDPRNGKVHITAKSISYGKMKPEVRAECYKALVTAALSCVFHTADENTENQLMSFF